MFVARWRGHLQNAAGGADRSIPPGLSETDQLTWIAGQVRAIGPGPVKVVSYRSLCADSEAVLPSLAKFCGMLPDPLLRAAASEGLATDTDRRYAAELPPTVIAWLEAFFDTRRRRQWDILEQA